MTMFLLLPFITYAIVELRAARRRERKLWTVIEEMAARIDDLSLELGLLAPRGVGAREALESFEPEDTEPYDDPAPRRALRVVNGGK